MKRLPQPRKGRLAPSLVWLSLALAGCTFEPVRIIPAPAELPRALTAEIADASHAAEPNEALAALTQIARSHRDEGSDELRVKSSR